MKKALLRLHVAVFLWGFTGVLGRAITLDSVWLVWYRLLITVLTIWGIYFFLKRIKSITFSSVLLISGIGFILALHWVFFYGSIKYANVTMALTCLSTTALISSLLEPLILRKKFDFFEIVLGCFAVAGIIIIYNTHIQFSIGIIIGLISAFLTVLASVLTKKIVDDYEPEQLTLYQLTGGFVGLSLLLPIYHYLFPAQTNLPSTSDWVWLVLLSWVCTVFTFFLYIRSLKKISAFTLNLILTLEPVYGIILAFLFYKENRLLSEWFYAGFALIMVAVLLHMWRLVKHASKENLPVSTPQ